MKLKHGLLEDIVVLDVEGANCIWRKPRTKRIMSPKKFDFRRYNADRITVKQILMMGERIVQKATKSKSIGVLIRSLICRFQYVMLRNIHDSGSSG